MLQKLIKIRKKKRLDKCQYFAFKLQQVLVSKLDKIIVLVGLGG